MRKSVFLVTVDLSESKFNSIKFQSVSSLISRIIFSLIEHFYRLSNRNIKNKALSFVRTVALTKQFWIYFLLPWDVQN